MWIKVEPLKAKSDRRDGLSRPASNHCVLVQAIISVLATQVAEAAEHLRDEYEIRLDSI
jgi:hypothetical protein